MVMAKACYSRPFLASFSVFELASDGIIPAIHSQKSTPGLDPTPMYVVVVVRTGSSFISGNSGLPARTFAVVERAADR